MRKNVFRNSTQNKCELFYQGKNILLDKKSQTEQFFTILYKA